MSVHYQRAMAAARRVIRSTSKKGRDRAREHLTSFLDYVEREGFYSGKAYVTERRQARWMDIPCPDCGELASAHTEWGCDPNHVAMIPDGGYELTIPDKPICHTPQSAILNGEIARLQGIVLSILRHKSPL